MSLPEPQPDHTVLITGASSGIGEHLARRLAELGHGLQLVARREDRLKALAAELHRATGVRVDVRPCDLGDDAARAALVTAIEDTGLFVSGVCNNAGFGTYGRFDALDLEREMEEVHVNVVALHHLTGAFVAPMVELGAGAILNVASVAAFQPLPGFATYSATKAFVQTFSEALHAELAGTGVSVTTLCPGPVATEWASTAGAHGVETMLPGPLTVSAEDVAAEAVRGMARGRRTVVPGIATKAMATGGRYVPRSVLLPAAKITAGSRLANP